MPAPSIVTSHLDVASPEWLVVPGPEDVTAAWRAEVDALFTVIAEVDRGEHGSVSDDGDTHVLFAPRPVDTASMVDDLIDAAADLGPGQWLVAGLGVPNRWPLPVVVSVTVAGSGTPDQDVPGQSSADLLALAGATAGLPTEPPEVDELPEHLGGEGPVVTRYDIDDAGAIWASVAAVRRQDGIDTHVLWRTRDLEVVPVFTPSVVALIGHVENEVTA
jgi:hypothetical protein